MGVTLVCEYTKRSMDLGYIGFNRLRHKIAELAGEPFFNHYTKLDDLMFSDFLTFDLETERLIRSGKVSPHVIVFLLAIGLRWLRHMEDMPEAAENHRRLRR